MYLPSSVIVFIQLKTCDMIMSSIVRPDGSHCHCHFTVTGIVQLLHINFIYNALQLCYDIFCPPFQYEPSKDVFNAAQSGAMLPNFVSHEFDYLMKQLKEVCIDSLVCTVIYTVIWEIFVSNFFRTGAPLP